MNKTALKNFATNARKELIEKVKAKAFKIGITEENIKKAQFESSDVIYIDGKQLSVTEKKQREKLISRIKEIGFAQVVEEVSYTFFNRFTALRFMEVNNYLPTKVRVLSSSNSDSSEPDIIKEALNVDLDIDKELVYELKLNNKTEELFKYLLIKQCNSLNKILPFMFETIDDYKEILFPEGLLAKDSFLREMRDIEVISESEWEQVEIIGWLYQYYIADEKDRVIKAKKKYKTEEIPYATQLFTPDWIVRYMVQNTLGRYWVESHPEHRDIIEKWEFYLENPNPEEDFEEELIRYLNKELKVEDIKCFDPAMGSGHILVYMFDALFDIYIKCGYMEREIPRLIIENNLYGVDIDDRAYQLACFSVVMKAMQYNSRFFKNIEREGLNINLASIQESNLIDENDIAYLVGESQGTNFEKVKAFFDQFKSAKTFGSLIKVEKYDRDFLEERLNFIMVNPVEDIFEEYSRSKIIKILPQMLKQAELMSSKYDILVTNPPYMGNNYMNGELSNFVKSNYPNTKSDLFSAFIETCICKVTTIGHLGFMTPFVWMFISAYEELRKKIVNNCDISSLIQLEYSAFEDATVPICTFTLRNNKLNISGQYVRLSDFIGAKIQPIKVVEAVRNPNSDYRYSTNSEVFKRVPGNLIVYWVQESAIKLFEGTKVSEYTTTREGMTTADNDRFLREWYEVSIDKIGFGIRDNSESLNSKKKWFPYQKGGAYRKWYGNLTKVVNWENDGVEIKNNIDPETGRIRSHNYNGNYAFKEGITFPTISSARFGARYSPRGYMFDTKGAMGFFNSTSELYTILALLNTTVAQYYLLALAPTLDFKLNKIMSIPAVIPKEINQVIDNCKKCIEISKWDWDSHEISWDFTIHPLLKHKNGSSSIEDAYKEWSSYSLSEFNRIKEKQEELNRIFVDTYGLQTAITSECSEDDITVNIPSREKDVKSFISFAVGCMFGRYSLDEKGVIFAGGKFDIKKYQSYVPVEDNIIPIVSGGYFEDDIISRFDNFIQIAFGEKMLIENLRFIADSLYRKEGETDKECLRKYFISEFFKDHVQVFSKSPIYWVFTSGKQRAFNCLIYMHRYDKTTLSRIRTDYLHELQIRMDAEEKSLLDIINGDGTAKEIANAKKELKSLNLKIEELRAYDERLHHLADMQIEIDLDDGVAVNYAKFEGLLAPIK